VKAGSKNEGLWDQALGEQTMPVTCSLGTTQVASVLGTDTWPEIDPSFF
jgi:hypothetical protein